MKNSQLSSILTGFIVGLFPSFIFANSMADIVKNIQPQDILPNYTQNPKEKDLYTDDHDASYNLKEKGNAVINENEFSKNIYNQSIVHAKNKKVPDGEEIKKSEQIILEIGKANKPPCTSDVCDNTKDENSVDMGEGITKLSALFSGANDVNINQVNNNIPGIFVGESITCKRYILGSRNCCKDSGWGKWAIHCPDNLKRLIKAKDENRVIYLGSFKYTRFGPKHFSYCVYPTKISFLIQTQGRKNQLNINFGDPKSPNCRGVTPEELSYINMSLIDFSSLEESIRSKIVLPDAHRLPSSIEDLNKKGVPHA